MLSVDLASEVMAAYASSRNAPAQTRQGGSESQRNHDFLKRRKKNACFSARFAVTCQESVVLKKKMCIRMLINISLQGWIKAAHNLDRLKLIATSMYENTDKNTKKNIFSVFFFNIQIQIRTV